MGMFDDIDYVAPCPICGKPLSDWQSKDAGRSLEILTPAQLWRQSELTRHARKESALPYPLGEYTHFYTGCDTGCGVNVEIRLSPGVFEFTAEELLRLANGERVERRRGPVISDGDA